MGAAIAEIMQACRELRPRLDGLMQQEAVDAAEWLGSAQRAGRLGSLKSSQVAGLCGEGKFKFHHPRLHVESDIQR